MRLNPTSKWQPQITKINRKTEFQSQLNFLCADLETKNAIILICRWALWIELYSYHFNSKLINVYAMPSLKQTWNTKTNTNVTKCPQKRNKPIFNGIKRDESKIH